MSRLYLLIIMLVMTFSALGQIKIIDGIKYQVIEPGEVKIIGGKVKENLVIPEIIEINGYSYKVTDIDLSGCPDLRSIEFPNSLVRIKSWSFAGCTNLKRVVFSRTMRYIGSYAFARTGLKQILIPNSVDTIGTCAFLNCKDLTEVILPDNPFVTWREYVHKATCEKYGWSINTSLFGKIFQGCENIINVRGNTILCPQYIWQPVKNSQVTWRILLPNDSNMEKSLPYNDALYENWYFEDCPFIQEKMPAVRRSFSYFAYNKIKKQIIDWQKKKEYETTAQWKKRVTEENRKRKLFQIYEKVQKEYIAEHAPKEFKGELGTFDADYGVYPINVDGLFTLYAQVPLSDAPAFKNNWKSVVLQPQYGVVDDNIGVLSCTFKLGNKIYQSTKNYSNDNSSNLAINLSPLEIDLSAGQGDSSNGNSSPASLVVDNEIDCNIPTTASTNKKVFAVIIGNENYQRVSKVNYALNDAQIFSIYCQKTLGIPISNIRRYKDATYGTMLSALKDIKNIANAYNGDINVIFYYAGHGVPNEANKNAYLLPIDADGTQPEVCLATSRLYQELEALHVRSVVVFMDACFSGAQRGEGMLASARGVALKVNTEVPQGNIVVFSAASGDETAFPYKEKGHGMFTYFLLKKLQESKGEVALGELGDYITMNVKQQSVVVNHKSQTPTVVSSVSLRGNWEIMRLK